MSNNQPADVRNSRTDPRVARTTHALGSALIELIQERRYDAITVQQIIDRAGVGRATFYAHYRNKDDALHSSYEGVFTFFESMLDQSVARRRRLFPVAEFAAHVIKQQALRDALRRSGRLDEAYEMFAGHLAAIIERRLASWDDVQPTVSLRLVSRMLAGALLEMLRWAEDHPATAGPEEMDRAFHELARGVLRKVS